MDNIAVEASSPLPPPPDPVYAYPRTQKARGITALARFYSAAFVPPFAVHPANEVDPAQLVGYFSRPCPMRPRHGFVDSREVHTIEEGSELIRRTLDADPEAEIVTMPRIEAAYSGIWTTGALAMGEGNDGAASGTSAWTIPALGDLVTEHIVAEAGVLGSPYVEILWPTAADEYRLVQLRDGPTLPATIDFIPQPIRVEHVIQAGGDLLDWEQMMRTVPPATVVHHPHGSLASHYAIHAVLNHVPVVISWKPEPGELLRPTADDPASLPDIAALRAGFHLATRLAANYKMAAYIMLAGCHHISVWAGKHDTLLGLALGFAYRLTVVAALGEMRHAPDREEESGRDDIYESCWNATHLPSTRRAFEATLRAFHELTWRKSYGGAQWFFFARWAAIAHNHLVTGDAQKTLETLNQLVHCAHNTGWAFNKFLPNEMLTITASNPIDALVRCAPALYQANRILAQRMDALTRRFIHSRSPVNVPHGDPNMDVIDDEEDRDDDWSPERRSHESIRNRRARRVRGRVRRSMARRGASCQDIP